MNKILKITLAILILALFLVSTISFASALVIDSVSMINDIKPGETSKISIGLENDGKEDIQDVSVVLDLTNVPFAPFNSASEDSISEIREDKTKYVDFEIIALNNAKSGIYKIPLIISYFENGDPIVKTKSSLISVVVDSKPIVDVNIEDGLFLKGKESEVLVKITNKGLSDAKFVEVENRGSVYFSLLSSNKNYIGDIDSDDFDSVKIKVFFKKDAPDKVIFPVTVIYKDDLNKEYREDFSIIVPVYTEKKAIKLGLMEKDNTLNYVVGIVLIIVFYVIYRKLKKKARNSSRNS